MSETIYATGVYGKMPSEKAPSFVRGSISIKVDDFIPFLHAHRNEKGYVTLQLKEGKEGRMNVTLDTWKPTPKAEAQEAAPALAPAKPKGDDDLPF